MNARGHVARWLGKRGHEVFSVYDDAPGISDAEVLRRTHEEERILIKNDKDFGGKVYRGENPHCGIVLLRLDNERSKTRSLFSAASWKNTLIVFRVALSSLQPSKYGLLARSNERGAL